ncbi:MAG: hypothetical protein KatS3mg115_2639 [Candidatus Poribacteria bacterium]|nr:MAG: hypothetical protein KatS3mg115_2639 [Candidatus Poribacteria bacterium]
MRERWIRRPPACWWSVLGRATKLFEQLQEHDKEYLATVRLGVETDTYDAEGRVVAEGEVPSDLSPETIAELLKAFEGEVEQVPPMYSALKFHGRPLYKLARKGITVPAQAAPSSN